MERSPTIDVDWEPCRCCGVAITGAWSDATMGTCELCSGFPFTVAPSCCGKHADELRMMLLERVQAGQLTPLGAVALAAIDDAHYAGSLREASIKDGQLGWWVVDQPAPDPDAWTRMSRMRDVNRTIQDVVASFVGPRARRHWDPTECRGALVARLTYLSREAGCPGIWRVEVASPRQIDIAPPADYIDADTVATRRRATIDGLVREALVT